MTTWTVEMLEEALDEEAGASKYSFVAWAFAWPFLGLCAFYEAPHEERPVAIRAMSSKRFERSQLDGLSILWVS
jgi:hypothetical protein